MLECTLCNRSVQTFKQDKMKRSTKVKNISKIMPQYRWCFICHRRFNPTEYRHRCCSDTCSDKYDKERERLKFLKEIGTGKISNRFINVHNNSSLESLYKLAGIEKKTKLIIYNEFPLMYIPKF